MIFRSRRSGARRPRPARSSNRSAWPTPPPSCRTPSSGPAARRGACGRCWRRGSYRRTSPLADARHRPAAHLRSAARPSSRPARSHRTELDALVAARQDQLPPVAVGARVLRRLRHGRRGARASTSARTSPSISTRRRAGNLCCAASTTSSTRWARHCARRADPRRGDRRAGGRRARRERPGARPKRVLRSRRAATAWHRDIRFFNMKDRATAREPRSTRGSCSTSIANGIDGLAHEQNAARCPRPRRRIR